MTLQSNRGFVTRVLTSIANRTSTTAAASHRPGWRTGTAWISSGGPSWTAVWPAPWLSGGVVTGTFPGRVASARRAVDHRISDGSGLDAPLLEDLGIGAVRDQNLHRGEHRIVKASVLRHGDSVRRCSVRLARELERAVRLLDLVRGDRRVGHCDLRPTRGECQVDGVLVVEDLKAHGRLAS